MTLTVRIIALAGASMMAACITTHPRKPDAPKPTALKRRTVDFAQLFQGLNSNSVYTGSDRDMMERVLLSPNLVFESSRSSVDEPDTWGPKFDERSSSGAPGLHNALGLPIDAKLSSLLMRHLVQSRPRPGVQTQLLAPALTKKWDPQIWCGGRNQKDCFEATWVERLMLMHSKLPARDGQSGYFPGSAQDEIPTIAFAVRFLGSYNRKVAVVVEELNGDLVFRPRRSIVERSLCEFEDLEVPTAKFEAELVSLKTGRLIARVDETRFLTPDQSTKVKILATKWTPVKATDYTEFLVPSSPVPASRYTYITRSGLIRS